MSSTWKKMRRRLWLKTAPRHLLCWVTLHHRYGDSEPVIIDGPIDLPPRERGWSVIAFHQQCSLCYKVRSQGFNFTDAVTAVRESILSDEEEENYGSTD